MDRRRFLLGLAAAAGCSSPAADDGAAPSPSATASATARPSTGTSTRRATATPEAFPNSLGTDAFALHLTGVRLRPAIFERFGGVSVVDEPGLQFLVLETATRVNGLREAPEFADDMRLTVRLDGTETPSPHARTLDTDPFRYAMGIPAGAYESATVVFDVDGATDTWSLPDAVVRRLARTPAFAVDAFGLDRIPEAADDASTARFTVRNSGQRAAGCLYTLSVPDGPGTVDHGRLRVPAGGTATATRRLDHPDGSGVTLDVGTDRVQAEPSRSG